MTGSPERPGMGGLCLWLAIVAGATALRSWGVGFGIYHADEPIVVNHALAYGTGDLHPHFFILPPLTSYLLFVIYGIFYVALRLLGQLPDLMAYQQLFIRHPEIFYVIGRIAVGVLPAVVTVALLGRVAGRERYGLGMPAALWAAALLAVNYLHVRDAHYIYADIPMTLCVLGAVLAAHRVRDTGTCGDHLVAGLWIGAATAFKYNAAVVLAAYLTAVVVGKRRSAGLVLTAAAGASVVYLLSNPFSVLDFGAFISDIRHQAGAEAAVGPAHHLLYAIGGSGGYALIAAALAGAALLFRQDARVAAVWAAFPVLFFIKLCVFSQHHERYVMPLLPFVCVAAGVAVHALIERAARRWRPAVVVLVTVSLIAFPLTKSVLADRLFGRADTRDEARSWIESRLPAGAGIAYSHTFFRPYPLRTSEQLLELAAAAESEGSATKSRLTARLQDPAKPSYRAYFLSEGEGAFAGARPRIRPDVTALRVAGVRYVVLHWAETTVPPDWYAALMREGKRLAVFSPYRDLERRVSEDRFSPTCAAWGIEELWSRRAFGPYLEVYDLGDPARSST